MTATDTSPGETAESPSYRALRKRVGTGLAVMAVLHVLVPKPFVAIVPKRLGAPRFWNLASAVAEGASAALLLADDRELNKAGGALATATFVGVYPANTAMALQAGKPTNPKAIAAWLRLPFQFPMIASGLKLAKGDVR